MMQYSSFLDCHFRININSAMFATIQSVTPAGLFVFTNEQPYKTKKEFIPDIHVDAQLALQDGEQIKYWNDNVVRQNFTNCYFCHKSKELHFNEVG